MCNAVRENPDRAEFIGYSPRMLRFIAFCFAAFFAGIAGALAAINFEIMNAQQLGAQQSGLVLLMTYVGGVGYFFGPIIGAVIITFLQVMLSDVTEAWQLYFGLLFMGVVLYSPGGLAGWAMLHAEAVRRGVAWRLAPSYALVAPTIAAGVAGAILLIELAIRFFQQEPGDGAILRLPGLSLDANAPTPWIGALALLAAGIGCGRLLWPRVGDAWGAVNLQLRGKAEA